MSKIWILSDGKPGHLNQSLGLVEALQRIKPKINSEVKPVSEGFRLLSSKEPPSLILSAGRKTQLWSLLCKLRFGVPNILLMRPALPYFLFDLVFVPEHDDPPIGKNIVTTLGAMNRMIPSEKDSDSRAILIGGPAEKHVIWSSEPVMTAVREIAESSRTPVTLATSRRTPAELEQQLLTIPNTKLITPSSVDQNWLPQMLKHTERVWVTSDSVSMVYEALTAGCYVSLIALESKPNSRTQQGIQSLQTRGFFTQSEQLESANLELWKFNEAERCARLVLERAWL